MKRLNGMDTFLYFGELPSAPQHTLKIAILDPSREPGGYSFPKALQNLGLRLHLLTPLRWRVVPTPLNLHNPVFVEDPDFDLEYHIRQLPVEAPGGVREMCEAISKITSWPLNYDKPLWQIWMLEGLEGGKVASVAKIHHTLADGVASARMLMRFYTTKPGEEPTVSEKDLWKPQPLPSKASLIGQALVDLPKTLLREVPRNYRAMKRSKKAQEERQASGAELNVPTPFTKVPDTPFNKPLTPQRIYACESFKLDDIKHIRATLEVTINDVFLTAVAGGLRHYLKRHNALPDVPLVGGMPFSLRGKDDTDDYGNRTVLNYVWLHTDIENVRERLAATHQSASEAKLDYHAKGAAEGFHTATWLELMPPLFGKGINTLIHSGKGPKSMSGNLVVSNVPGPREYLWVNHTRLDSWFSTGQVVEGVGLNITVWSYVNQFNMSLLACRDLVPDLWDLLDDIRESLEELKMLAQSTKPAK